MCSAHTHARTLLSTCITFELNLFRAQKQKWENGIEMMRDRKRENHKESTHTHTGNNWIEIDWCKENKREETAWIMLFKAKEKEARYNEHIKWKTMKKLISTLNRTRLNWKISFLFFLFFFLVTWMIISWLLNYFMEGKMQHHYDFLNLVVVENHVYFIIYLAS